MNGNKFIITYIAMSVCFFILMIIGLIQCKQKPPINIVNHTLSSKETFDQGVVYGAMAAYESISQDSYTNGDGIISRAYALREEYLKKEKK